MKQNRHAILQFPFRLCALSVHGCRLFPHRGSFNPASESIPVFLPCLRNFRHFAFGAWRQGYCCSAIRKPVFPLHTQAPIDTEKNIRVVRYMIISCYGLGGLLFVIEVLSAIQIALIPELPERAVLKATISAVCSLLVPLVISEAFLRPLKARLETLADK